MSNLITEKSEGHQETIGAYEYFIRDGQLYAARVDLPVMPDGYRCGRWQTSESRADEYIEMAKEMFELGPQI